MAERELTVDVFVPLVVRDLLTGQGTFLMTPEQRGMLVWMCLHAWIATPAASLPDDDRALARYADASSERWAAVGDAVRAEWKTPAEMRALGHADVPDDGRLRCPWLWARYVDAMARRTKAHASARNAAEARWRKGSGREPEAEPPRTARSASALPADSPSSSSSSSPSPTPPDASGGFAEVVAPYPALVAWSAEEPARLQQLHRLMTRVVREHGAGALPGFVGVLNGALDGMQGARCTGADLLHAIEDWCDTASAPATKNSLRAYLRGALARPGRVLPAPFPPRRATETRGATKLTTEYPERTA